jgi:hypothetical protein
VFPSVKVQDLAQLEKKILSLLMFDVSLNAKDYTRLYFELRDISHQAFSLKPLDKEGQKLLEERTKILLNHKLTFNFNISTFSNE